MWALLPSGGTAAAVGVLLLALASCTVTATTRTPIEMVEETGCHRTKFSLKCRALSSMIAIREAVFVPDNATLDGGGNETDPCVYGPVALPLNGSALTMSEDEMALLAGTNDSLAEIAQEPAPDFNLRAVLNKRCSGMNYCSFILKDDHPASRDWGGGFISIRYACMTDERVSRFCGEKIDVSKTGEGFLVTPGFPKYYVGGRECTWEVRGAPGQAIGVEVIDLSLRGIAPHEQTCTDVLEVLVGEDSQRVMSYCGEHSNLPIVRSSSGPLRMKVRTNSKTLFPKRGVLMRYMALSCPSTPLAPRDGYLVHSNESLALYMCCVGMAFPDNGKRGREVRCQPDFTWSRDVPDCVNASSLNLSHVELPLEDLRPTIIRATMIQESDIILDLVVPSVIIATLLVGNTFILAIIFHLKRRQLVPKEVGDAEELGEILPPAEDTTTARM